MESADQDLEPTGPKLARKIRRTRELIGLHSGQRNHRSSVGEPVGFDDSLYGDLFDGIVENFDLQFNVPAEQLAFCKVPGKAAEARKRVAWKHAPKMADDISF